MTIRTIEEANQALQPYVPLVAQLTGKDTTLNRIFPLMKLLGDPQDKLRVVHIAGTSGKTSTAYFLSAMLKESGQKVGLTVSPHVDRVSERVQINNMPLDDAEFCSELSEFLAIVERAEQKPSYFELLYAFSLWVFVRKQVDYAVVETGMGGLFDATNVVTRPDKVCVITDIGYDHMHILGNTLEQIAAQKIGIVHERNVVFCYRQSDEVMQVFRTWCHDHQAPLHELSENTEQNHVNINFEAFPLYQQRNWLLALHTVLYLSERDKLRSLTSQELQRTVLVQVPGRMDVITVGNKTIVMDGAHNAQKMGTFIGSFQALFPGVRPVVAIAMKDNKDYQEVVGMLANFAASVIITTFRSSQDLPVKSLDPAKLSEAFGASVHTEIIVDPHEACEALVSSSEPVGVITGSFYLLSQIRNNAQTS